MGIKQRETTLEAAPMSHLDQDWLERLASSEEELEELSPPRKSRLLFDKKRRKLSKESYVYRANYICGEIDVIQRSYLNDVLASGLLYTNDFKQKLLHLNDYRNTGADTGFADDTMAQINARHGAGLWRCRGLYMFLELRDCVKMQYVEANAALVPSERHRLSAVTRIKLKHLPWGIIWPDVIPQDGYSSAVHVCRTPNLEIEIPRIPPECIEVWYGRWTRLAALDITHFKADYDSMNLSAILVPLAGIG